MNFNGIGVARNLYVAVQPTVADAGWPTSKMDFRSNEAGRTEQEQTPRHRGCAKFQTVKAISLTPPIVAAGASSPL